MGQAGPRIDATVLMEQRLDEAARANDAGDALKSEIRYNYF